jgi:hypothetical protein
MGVVLSVLLITSILGAYQLALLIVAPQGPAWRLIRRARTSVVVRRALYDLDREYQELLRRDGPGLRS